MQIMSTGDLCYGDNSGTVKGHQASAGATETAVSQGDDERVTRAGFWRGEKEYLFWRGKVLNTHGYVEKWASERCRHSCRFTQQRPAPLPALTAPAHTAPGRARATRQNQTELNWTEVRHRAVHAFVLGVVDGVRAYSVLCVSVLAFCYEDRV